MRKIMLAVLLMVVGFSQSAWAVDLVPEIPFAFAPFVLVGGMGIIFWLRGLSKK